MGNAIVPFGAWHGDFGPWNMSRSKAGLSIWDWERSASLVPLGFDVLHFGFQVSYAIQGSSIPTAAREAVERGRMPLEAMGVPQRAHRDILTAYLIERILRVEEGRANGVRVRSELTGQMLDHLETIEGIDDFAKHITHEEGGAPRSGRRLLIYTTPTAGLRELPDFLIIGAQRCGTTSLYRYLEQHPGMAPVGLKNKGIHYFDTNFSRGVNWYRSHFPTSAYRAIRAREYGGRVITGEGSPYYIFHPLSPARIAVWTPDVRCVLMLRGSPCRVRIRTTNTRSHGGSRSLVRRRLASGGV